MFCLETAVKLLTFSWVVYNDTTPPAAEQEVRIDLPDPESKDLPQTLQAKEVKVMQTVRAPSTPHSIFCDHQGHQSFHAFML